MPDDGPYPIMEVRPEWVLEAEVLGSKEKFWFRRSDHEPEWLFKFPQQNTGQHWAEKIAAEIAACLGIAHAEVELAIFDDTRGSSSKSFAQDGRDLFHGNQILAGQVLGYDPQLRFGQGNHTLSNIFLALERAFITAEGVHRSKIRFAEYLALDALIGNTDRHHENWGILVRRTGAIQRRILAPTFDHAASLGRELRDVSDGKCRRRLLTENRVGDYSESARGGIYWAEADRHGVSPLALVRRAAPIYPQVFGRALAKLRSFDRQNMDVIIDRIPIDWMTALEREFAARLLNYNLNELLKVAP